MIVYLAGPMRGLPDLGRGAFQAVAEKLTLEGHTVINPGCLPVTLPDEKYMPICLAMLEVADAICMLPGWGKSSGARLELHYAINQGKKVFHCDLL